MHYSFTTAVPCSQCAATLCGANFQPDQVMWAPIKHCIIARRQPSADVTKWRFSAVSSQGFGSDKSERKAVARKNRKISLAQGKALGTDFPAPYIETEDKIIIDGDAPLRAMMRTVEALKLQALKDGWTPTVDTKEGSRNDKPTFSDSEMSKKTEK
eukprot:CAMPEP_0196664304 /NCGR_PEP_ID=MMETSP1086-20130531/56606_1 /TAXON_ID=77921 /ORGANISM="Cyanoptyche  gloeocystis , Strain SAG4.97" /LENGTH=155 /DNA_ID=CAMNT_0042000563 /DNA_START=12 /DNA_END=479 /DNA_ORIENTATION=+